MSDDLQNFKISPQNYLNFEYEEFQNEMYALALSDPKKYFSIRNAVVKYIRDTTVEAWFQVFYNALTSGTKEDGYTKIHPDLPPPRFPAQDVSKKCIGIGRTVQSVAQEICDIIIPARFEDIAQKRTHDKASAAGL